MVCVCVCLCVSVQIHVEVREQLLGVGSLLLRVLRIELWPSDMHSKLFCSLSHFAGPQVLMLPMGNCLSFDF